MKAITIYDDEDFLRQTSIEVNINEDNNLKKDIEILDAYCKENKVLAMAAVQLGIPKRIIYLKNTSFEFVQKVQNNNITEKEELEYNESQILINPVILKKEGLTEYWEACASCVDNMGRVLRPYKIYLEYYDISGIKQEKVFEGFESTVLAHEFDHLDGILHMDIAEEVLVMQASERRIWRQSHDYKIIQKTGNYDELKKQKTLIKN